MLKYLVYLNQFSNAFRQLCGVEGRQAASLRRRHHPVHVVHRPEQPNPVVLAPVRLHSLEQLLSIVKHLGRILNCQSCDEPKMKIKTTKSSLDYTTRLTFAPGCME